MRLSLAAGLSYTDGMPINKPADFSLLTPERVLDAVETALEIRLDPWTQPLPSYVNRVYGLRAEDGTPLVAKFYRPNRWPHEALLEEHRFVRELAEAEIPVVEPMELRTGETLGHCGTIGFAVLPRRGGRPFEALDTSAWERVGTLLGRMHAVGAAEDAPHRRDLHPEASMQEDIDFLVAGTFIAGPERDALHELGQDLIDRIAPLFDTVAPIRLHGDFQRTNLLERPDTGLLPIDFDDMMNGPAVQDLWLLLPDAPENCPLEIDALLRGYTRFMPFDDATLALIEPLRTMRMIHYLSWCARQYHDYGFAQAHADWGTDEFWQQEIRALREQEARLPPEH